MPDIAKQISIDKIACPLHVLALKKGLADIGDNEVLKVITGGHSVSNELAAACHTLGHEVSTTSATGETVLLVRKKPGATDR